MLNSLNIDLQLKGTESAIRNKLIDLLAELKGVKFVMTLLLEFQKIESDDKTKYNTFYLNLKVKTVINESDIGDAFQSIHSTTISNMQKSLGKGSGRITDSVKDHNINI